MGNFTCFCFLIGQIILLAKLKSKEHHVVNLYIMISLQFVVHIGVHGCKRLIKLETTSYGYGYMTRDVSGNQKVKRCVGKRR